MQSKLFISLSDTIKNRAPIKLNPYISKEYQDYGYRLAVELNDLPHKSLYIKWAKTMSRAVLEQARSFVSDAQRVDNRAKLFMWKVQQIRSLQKEKKESEQLQPTLF